jgi:hypothetical protein
MDGFFPFGSGLTTSYWQGLIAPFVVELFASSFFQRNPEGVGFRLVDVTIARLATPACVKRTTHALREFHHESRKRDLKRPLRFAPALNLTDLQHFNRKRVALARIRACYGIELEDYSSSKRDYSQEHGLRSSTQMNRTLGLAAIGMAQWQSGAKPGNTTITTNSHLRFTGTFWRDGFARQARLQG